MTDKKDIPDNVININSKETGEGYSQLVETLTELLQMDKYMMFGLDNETGEITILSNSRSPVEQLGLLESCKFAVASTEEEEED